MPQRRRVVARARRVIAVLQRSARVPDLLTPGFENVSTPGGSAPRSARAADPVEHPGAPLTLEGDGIVVELAAREIRTVLVRFAAQLT